jgi:Peptidase family M28
VIVVGCARHQQPPQLPATNRSAASSIQESSIRAHLEFLASDAMNGRGSGTRDEWIAAVYIAAQLRRLGIESLGDDGGYVQDVAIERSELAAPPILSFAGGHFTHNTDMSVLAVGGAKLSGPLQKYREGTPVTAGSVLLLPEANPPPTDVTAPARIVLSLESEALRTRRVKGPPRAVTITRIVGVPERAAVALGKESYAAIAALDDGTAVALDAEIKSTQTSHTWNAMGRLTGSSPADARDVILLTAHLDHLGNRPSSDPKADTINNGADDDASGSVAVLALAEALATGPRPKRTIVFAWFGSEESGGFGARRFIDGPPVPLTSIVANLEFEMIGRPDAAVAPHTLWLTGYERSTLGPELARQGARLVQDPHPEQNFFQRSDNIQLARRGVIAQTVSSYGLHAQYHQPSDDLSHIDFAHMTEAISSMLQPVRWLANSAFRPAWLPGKKP